MIKCEPIYTGGGIYCFLGQLSENRWFIACDDNYDFTVIDTDPWLADDEEIWQWEWIEKHLVLQSGEFTSLLFFEGMLEWIIDNEPNGNYQMCELERDLDEVRQLIQQNN